MVDQKEEMDDEALPMEEEHSEDIDKSKYEDEDESGEGKSDEENEDSDEYDADPDKQGTSAAAAMGDGKKKSTLEKPQHLPKFNDYGKIKISLNSNMYGSLLIYQKKSRTRQPNILA
jgi:hypothetical protein